MYKRDHNSHNCDVEIEKYQKCIASVVEALQDRSILKERAEHHDIPYSFGAMNKEKNKGRLAYIPKERKKLRGHFGKVYAMQWSSSDPYLLVSAAQDGKLIVWNAMTNTKLHCIGLKSTWVMTCAFSKSGKRVACGGLDNICSIYNLDSSSSSQPQKADVELLAHEGYISCCRFVDDDNKILSASGDQSCILWDINKKTSECVFQGHNLDVMSVSVMEGNPNFFVSGSVDATARLWDIRLKPPNCNVRTFRGHLCDINAVSFFPQFDNGVNLPAAFATASDDSTCKMFDIRAVSQIQKYGESESLICGITSIQFSKSGRMIFCGYDENACNIWDTLHGERICELKHAQQFINHHRVSCIGLNKDGRALCTGSWDTFLKIWA